MSFGGCFESSMSDFTIPTSWFGLPQRSDMLLHALIWTTKNSEPQEDRIGDSFSSGPLWWRKRMCYLLYLYNHYEYKYAHKYLAVTRFHSFSACHQPLFLCHAYAVVHEQHSCKQMSLQHHFGSPLYSFQNFDGWICSADQAATWFALRSFIQLSHAPSAFAESA